MGISEVRGHLIAVLFFGDPTISGGTILGILTIGGSYHLGSLGPGDPTIWGPSCSGFLLLGPHTESSEPKLESQNPAADLVSPDP